MKRKLNLDTPLYESPPEPPPPPTPSPPKVSHKAQTDSGNGHRQAKKRDLTQGEKDLIETELFLKNNGCIDHDACVAFKAKLAPEITIFQVTGWVTACHARVAKGGPDGLRVSDERAYKKNIESHRSTWVSYDSEKYRQMKTRFESRDKSTFRSPRFQTMPASRTKVA